MVETANQGCLEQKIVKVVDAERTLYLDIGVKEELGLRKDATDTVKENNHRSKQNRG